MAPAIVVENVSKRFRIARSGEERVPYRTLRDDLVRWAKYPIRALRGQTEQTEDFWALKDVGFEVQPGEVVGVIGRNGTGKSTLLKILSRITRPTSGRVRLRGRVGSLLEVGTGFHPELTGRENIYLSGAILGMSRAEIRRKFDEMVAFAEVEKFLELAVKRYSSGMYMRLAFAVAAHLEPEILLVDEVLAVGDAAFQKKCLGKMGAIAKGGRTVLFVSHNMTAVISLCRRALLMEAGSVAFEGPAEEVTTRYLKSDAIHQLSRSWEQGEGPGDQHVRLQSASVAISSPESEDKITVKSPLRFEFEFENSLPDATLNFSVVLNENERGCVFNTASGAFHCPTGRIRGAFHVPSDFLNDGVYSVRILIVKDTSIALLDEHNVLVFQVHDTVRDAAWFGKWIGAVRPAFDWEVKLPSAARGV